MGDQKWSDDLCSNEKMSEGKKDKNLRLGRAIPLERELNNKVKTQEDTLHLVKKRRRESSNLVYGKEITHNPKKEVKKV